MTDHDQVPDRESLVLGIQLAVASSLGDGDDERSPAEVTVDEVILPLLRRLVGDAGTSPNR